jgi:predicted dehydrogenase
MGKLNFGVIGCGAIAQRAHLPTYRSLPDNLIAVSDIDEKKVKSVAKQFNAQPYTDYNLLLDREDIDAVSICVPPALHAEIAVKAAEQKKHILCEKPISLTLDDANQMINAAKRSNVILMIGHHLRFQDNLIKLKENIKDKSLGEIVMIKGHWLGKSALFGGWRTQSDYYKKRQLGGDVLLNYGTHVTDLVHWLSGDVVEVYANTDIYGAKTDIQVHDRANVFLRFENGVIGDLSFGYFPYEEHWIEVIGKRGRIICDLFKNTMDIRYGSRSVKTTFKQMKSGWIREIEHFVECIHNNLQPQVTGEDGKKALEMVLAAYTSQETRNPVNLPP